MISWHTFYMSSFNHPIALGQHDSGVCCFMDSFLDDSGDRAAYALTYTGPLEGGYILAGIFHMCNFIGNAGEITEQLDKYINEHNHDYYYEWPELDLTNCTEYTP